MMRARTNTDLGSPLHAHGRPMHVEALLLFVWLLIVVWLCTWVAGMFVWSHKIMILLICEDRETSTIDHLMLESPESMAIADVSSMDKALALPFCITKFVFLAWFGMCVWQMLLEIC